MNPKKSLGLGLTHEDKGGEAYTAGTINQKSARAGLTHEDKGGQANKRRNTLQGWPLSSPLSILKKKSVLFD